MRIQDAALKQPLLPLGKRTAHAANTAAAPVLTEERPLHPMRYPRPFFGSQETKTETKSQEVKNAAKDFLKTVGREVSDEFQASKSVMGFQELLEMVMDDPKRYLPTSSTYLQETFRHYGIGESAKILGEEIPSFSIAKAPWRSDLLKKKRGVIGQDKAFLQLYKIFEDFRRNGNPNKIILFFGPMGSGKSEITNVLLEGMEEFSKQHEGSRFTFSWVFRSGDSKEKGQNNIGFKENIAANNPVSESNDENALTKNIDVMLPTNMNIHPIFLLPKAKRAELIQTLIDQGKLTKQDNYDYFIKGELDTNSQTILTNLLKKYNGDIDKVFRNHVLVEKWTLSEHANRGLVKIPASVNRDARMQRITPNVDWSKLPPFIQRAGLVQHEGHLPNANGGLMIFDDMGRDLDPARYLYLLMTAETGEAVIQEGGHASGSSSVTEQTDVIIMASANPDGIAKILMERQWGPLAERIVVVPIHHIRQFKTEAKVYEPFLKNEQLAGRKVGPDVLDALSLFMVATRMFPPNAEYEAYGKIEDESFQSGLRKIQDPMMKALLYQEEDLNSYEISPDKFKFSQGEQESLKKYMQAIANEYNNGIGKFKFHGYEGGHGLSVRDGERFLQQIISYQPTESPLTILDVFEVLSKVVKDTLPYHEELRHLETMEKSGKPDAKTNVALGLPTSGTLSKGSNFHAPVDLLKSVEGHYRRKVQTEIKQALGLYRGLDENIASVDHYLKTLQSYLDHKTHGTVVAEEETVLSQMESIIGSSAITSVSKPEEVSMFRHRLLGRLNSYDGNKTRQENLRTLYSMELQKLTAFDESEARKKVEKLKLNDKAIEQLVEKGYPKESLKPLFDWAFSSNFIANGTYTVKR